MVVDGESFIVFRQRAEGLRLQLMPAEQVDESLTRELGGGAFIAAGIEFNADGGRVAYTDQASNLSQKAVFAVDFGAGDAENCDL